MTNIIDFPQHPRIEVSCGVDVKTGRTTYIVDHIDGHGRRNIGVFTDAADLARTAGDLIAQGYDVIWDDVTRRYLFGGAS